MYNYKYVFSACLLALLLSCSGNFEPIPSGSRAGASSVESSSSTEEPSSSSTEDEYESSSSEEFSSSSTEESSSSSVASSDESSSSITPSSSSNSNCGDFTDNNQTLFLYGIKGKFCDERDGIKYSYVSYKSDNQSNRYNQTWMAENLNFEANGSTCTGDCMLYGKYYDWSMTNNVCPYGWHLPTEEEWMNLMVYIKRSYGGCLNISNISELYDCASKDIKQYLINNSNNFHFYALLGGLGNSYNSFSEVGHSGNWWSNAEVKGPKAYIFRITANNNNVEVLLDDKNKFFNIRCVKDI